MPGAFARHDVGMRWTCTSRAMAVMEISASRLRQAPQYRGLRRTSRGDTEKAWRKAVLNCEGLEKPQLKQTSVTVVCSVAVSSSRRAFCNRWDLMYSDTVTPSARKISCR